MPEVTEVIDDPTFALEIPDQASGLILAAGVACRAAVSARARAEIAI
jgi:hypothetical protein